jgi:GNAT superfamily N-acetyltransferase
MYNINMMKHVIQVDLENLNETPQPCRKCMFWQTSQKTGIPYSPKDGLLQKEQWFSRTLLEWGRCAKLLKEDEDIVGYAQFGPVRYFPQSVNLKSGPIDENAVFLACLYITPEARERRLGKYLLRSIIKECSKMGFEAIETYGKRSMKSNSDFDQRTIEFYENEGFRVIKNHMIYPRMRLDLKNTVVWGKEISKAIKSLGHPIIGRNKHIPAHL